MHRLIATLLTILMLSIPCFAGEKGHRSGENYTIYDRSYRVRGYVRDGKIYDRKYRTRGYIKDDKVYDRRYRPQYYIDRDKRYNRDNSKSVK
jgi:hypothetical protein